MIEENKRLKIAYVTADDPKSKRSWSGTRYYIAQALQKHCGDVYYIGPMKSRQRMIARLIHEFYRHILRKNFTFHHCFYVAKSDARIAAQRLAGLSFDVIFAPAGATQIAFLDTSIPIALLQDATYIQKQEYYPYYSNLARISIRQGNAIDYLAIQKSKAVIQSSTWAARSAVEDYQADPQNVYVVPLGANFDHPPSKEVIQERKKSERCRLLFVGVDWERKGGEIAFEALVKLEEMGIKAELVVVGCVPPKQFAHERMTVVPYLNKNDPQQYKELENLYVSSDFLLLPTRNECYGIVFCEANAYGLPVITTDTGGVSEIVRNGENGFMLPIRARGGEYAAVIARLYQDEEQYAELVRSSRAAYDGRLNWDSWGIAVRKILQKAVSADVPRSSHV